MTVYVDDVRHSFGNMIMCHLWADTLEELLAMVDEIGVQRKWIQKPPKASWVHFDIALSKKALAIKAGAILTDKYGPVVHTAKLDLKSTDQAVRLRAHEKLASIERIRAGASNGQK